MGICTSLLVLLWKVEFSIYVESVLYLIFIVFSVGILVITHNHQHLSMWKNKTFNLLTDCWLTIFHGFPVFSWIPTHNANHHVYVNGEKDRIRTYRYRNGDNLFTLLTYPTWVASAQAKFIFRFYLDQRVSNPKLFWKYTLQFSILILWLAGAFSLDWYKALVLVIVPQQIAQYFIFMFNYLQHVHTDQKSEFNHSRNFTGGLVNFIYLNNGYHAVHHENAGWHWSVLKEKHDNISKNIHPSLNVSNVGAFMLRSYIFPLMSNRFGTKQEMILRNEQGTA